MTDGPNLLGSRGAATMIGRDKNQVQIRIVCETEEEAKAILEEFRSDIKKNGRAVMYFGGTLDEAASNGQRN